MTETKTAKTRRTKKETTRQTDDLAHTLATVPTHDGSYAHRFGDALPFYDTDEDGRRRMIAEAAYYRALRRGFANGSPETDWLEAEAEVVARLAGAGVRG